MLGRCFSFGECVSCRLWVKSGNEYFVLFCDLLYLLLVVCLSIFLLLFVVVSCIHTVNPEYFVHWHMDRTYRVFFFFSLILPDAFPYNGPGMSNGARPAGRDRFLHAFACRMSASQRNEWRKTLTFLVLATSGRSDSLRTVWGSRRPPQWKKI